MSRPSGLERIEVDDMDNSELDLHLEDDHDRTEGERGLLDGRAMQVLTHASLHRLGVWDKIPHTHNGTLPFGGQQ